MSRIVVRVENLTGISVKSSVEAGFQGLALVGGLLGLAAKTLATAELAFRPLDRMQEKVNTAIGKTNKTYVAGPIKFAADHTAKLALVEDQWQGGKSLVVGPTKANPDVNHCHTVLALHFTHSTPPSVLTDDSYPARTGCRR